MVCFSLGSNMGDKPGNLRQAVALLGEKLGKPCAVSSIYKTEPWGVTGHDDYLNMAVCFNTTFSPDEIFEITSSIESRLGRKRSLKTVAPRTIDIDLLFYHDEVIKTSRLSIPHPRLKERKFVLAPLDEIMGDFKYPRTDLTIHDLLLQCKDTCSVEKTSLNLFSTDV